VKRPELLTDARFAREVAILLERYLVRGRAPARRRGQRRPPI
jgi:hypothetical protein